MYFIGENHIERYKEALDSSECVKPEPDGLNGKVDRYYGTAFYLLTATPSIWRKCKDYASDKGIYFDRIQQEQDFSSSEEITVMLARVLFENRGTLPLSLIILLSYTDVELFNCCRSALSAFYCDNVTVAIKKAASVGERE